MTRHIRNTVILAKIEGTAGTDAVPTGASDAVLVSNVSITPLEASNVNRDLVRGYLGGSEQLVATAAIKASMTVELAGAAAAGTAPQWGDLLLACGMAEAVLSTPARVEYTPVTDTMQSLTSYYYDSGVLHKLLYAMGNAKISAKIGDRPTIAFDFTAIDGGISAATNATPTLTAWKTPVTMTRANVVDVTLGCTYSAGAISGGTVYPSTGIEIDLGNAVNHVPLLSSERVDISQREVTGNVQFDLSAAQEVSFMATVKANTTQSLALTIGTTTGNKIIIFCPAVQLIKPTKQDLNGSRLIGYELRMVPSTGNDELRIVSV